MSPKNQVRSATERTAAVDLTEFSTKRRGPVRRFFFKHPVLMDLTVVLIFLLFSAINTVSSSSEGHLWPLIFSLLMAGLLFFRRRMPLLVLILVSACEILVLLSPPNQPYNSGWGMIFALYAVAAARGARIGFSATAAVSLPLGALMFWAFSWITLPPQFDGIYPWTLWISTVGFMILGNVIATGIGVMIWRDRKHDLEVQEWARRNVSLASANERNRIAREMHDVVAHSLSVMIALSDGAQVALNRSPERAEEALQKLSQTGRGALADMQRVLGVLRREEPVEQVERRPLSRDFDIEGLLAGFRAAGMPLSFSFSGPALPVDSGFQLAVYRIVQESLTNVLRYAQHVSRVEVKISHLHPFVELLVSDDGRAGLPRGASAVRGSGQGLIGMRERAAAYAGEVSAGPRSSGGWLVEARLACPETEVNVARENS
ncbi:sensor histidine kinase [Psychromicrobium lacuslunae]|uniref:sensor histidine kinase n=1 Tax=Psychromicrobium lacuslunae TaxID=1618207 RepID=UPI0005D2E861|nr:histidine kinase [Psychromicrobium lacuslunae]